MVAGVAAPDLAATTLDPPTQIAFYWDEALNGFDQDLHFVVAVQLAFFRSHQHIKFAWENVAEAILLTWPNHLS